MPRIQFLDLPREVLDQIAEQLIMATNSENAPGPGRNPALDPLYSNAQNYGLVHPRFRASVEHAFWAVTAFKLARGVEDRLWHFSRRVMLVPRSPSYLNAVQCVRTPLSELKRHLAMLDPDGGGGGGETSLLTRLGRLRDLVIEYHWVDIPLPEGEVEQNARRLVAAVPSLQLFCFDIRRAWISEGERQGLQRFTEVIMRAIAERNARGR